MNAQPSPLTQVDENIWLCEGEVVNLYGFPYNTRMVIVRLSSGQLWLWSPITLYDELRREIVALGPVAHLISPNKLHHLYLGEWKTAFPQAKVWGPQSTIKKRKDLTFELPALNDTPPPEWSEEIDQAQFSGSPLFEEIVFFHKSSKTVIIGDMSENFEEHFLNEHWSAPKRWIAKLCKIVEGYGYAPLEIRATWHNRHLLRATKEKIMAWNAQKVIMAHGKWQREGGSAYLQQCFAWIK